nr:hypothetical protein [uncultured Bdellovibrio sp.]
MNKFVSLTLSVIMFSSVSNARIVKGNGPQPQPQSRYVSVEDCGSSLYNQLSTYRSATDAACSHGRTDYEFQQCAIKLSNLRYPFAGIETAGFFCANNVQDTRTQDCTISLAKYFNSVGWDAPQYGDPRLYSLSLCRGSLNPSYAQCVITLHSRGGQELQDTSLAIDAHRLCRNGTNQELNNCITDAYYNNGMSGPQAARVCLEKFDPVAKARREAELRRIEEDKRRQAEEARRAAEQRAAAQRAAEQRAAEQRAAEQRAVEQRRLDEQRRQEEQRRQSTEQQQQQQQRTQEQKRQEELRRQQEEQRKKDEEARKKKEEEEKKKQQEQQQQPSNPPANNGGGVIVDLPAFE